MSTSTVEPGARLADRFRLEDRVSESGGSTLWKAIDEVLARPVAVRTFAAGFPRITEVVTAARAASRLSDPRLTQVFDAADEDDHSYVVSEWVTGETLVDLLEGGPLEPDRAVNLIAEAAEALGVAHAAGLTHLCITPACLVWSSGGSVKLLGLGVDAALGDVTSEDPAREDTEGLARLLYAALTGHWPGHDETDLPPAPLDDGKPCTPRQVLAGVPSTIDAITCRALLQEPRRGQPPLSTPGDLAQALGELPRRPAIPQTAMLHPPAVDPSLSGPMDTVDALRPTHLPLAPPPLRRSPNGGSFVARALVTLLVVLVMIAIGVGAWTLGRTIGGKPPAIVQPTPSVSTTDKTSSATTIKLASVKDFDPLGDNEENPEYLKNATDGKPSTEWHTDTYVSAELGRLKSGVGLLVDLGRQVSLSSVTATLGKAPGSSVELKVGNSPDLDSMSTVAKVSGASGETTLTPEKATTGRYLVLWFTKVPFENHKYRGTVYEITVKGV
ncbi:protein kinase family protein [Rhizohabitans arisaemae]|uniref:protein kinase family protein n=1 Tax=Rhizohabitans arisaemae TaxID=2720610 RepID=UPI0024B10A7A|nr:protein kinase family protein [Rhizohabitans arisaemae]